MTMGDSEIQMQLGYICCARKAEKRWANNNTDVTFHNWMGVDDRSARLKEERRDRGVPREGRENGGIKKTKVRAANEDEDGARKAGGREHAGVGACGDAIISKMR